MKMHLLVFLTLLVPELSFMFCSCTGHILNCSKIEYALLGQEKSIDCLLRNVMEVYWFSESTSFKTLVVKVENGQKTIAETAEGSYDISDDGALIIKDVKEEHFEKYKILCHFFDDEYEEAFVDLRQAIPPGVRCTRVSQCKTCNCSDPEFKMYHVVNCSIHRSRPQIELQFDFDGSNNFKANLLKDDTFYDNQTDTYDTIVSLTVNFLHCGSTLAVHCGVKENSIFNVGKSTLYINSEPCRQTTVESRSYNSTTVPVSLSVIFTVLFVTCAVLVLALILLASLWLARRRRKHKTKGKYSTLPMIEKRVNGYSDAVSYLANSYVTTGYIQPIPWGDLLPINIFYVAPSLNIERPNKETLEISSELFLNDQSFNEEPLVLFISELGFGKTTFIQYLSYIWANDTNVQQKYVLLAISLNGINSLCGITDVILSQLKGPISRTFVQQVLQANNCLLVLDGLDEMSRKTASSSNTRITQQQDTTIQDLLNGKRTSNKMRLWITARTNEYTQYQLSPSFLKVHLMGFSDKQLKRYVSNTCKYYQDRTAQQTVEVLAGNANSVELSDTPKKSIELPGDVTTKVSDILESNDIFTDFRKTPLMLVMLIHIIALKVCGIHSPGNDIHINLLSTLIAAVLTCLEKRFLLKQSTVSESEINKLKMKLGEFCCHRLETATFNKEELKESLNEDDINLALAIGFIRPSSHKTSTTAVDVAKLASSSVSSYEFCHEFIQLSLVALFIVEDSSHLNEILTLDKHDDKRCKIAQFICGFDKPNNELNIKILKTLYRDAKYDFFIDCFYESRQAVEKNVVKTFWKNAEENLPSPVVRDLSRKYRQLAYNHFCDFCQQNDLPWRRVIFQRNPEVAHLVKLKTVSVYQIVFLELQCAHETKFIQLLNWAKEHDLKANVQFVKCVVPRRISDPQSLPMNIKVYKGDALQDLSLTTCMVESFLLNRHTGKWDRVTLLGIRKTSDQEDYLDIADGPTDERKTATLDSGKIYDQGHNQNIPVGGSETVKLRIPTPVGSKSKNYETEKSAKVSESTIQGIKKNLDTNTAVEMVNNNTK